MDFTEFAAMQQFDRFLASVECMTPASLADRARADGRRVVLTAQSSRTEAAGGARAGVRMVQSREIRVPRCLAGWCVTVCASRADVRTQSRWTECCADIAAIQDRVLHEVPEAPGGFVLRVCGCERPTWSSCARVSCSVQVHRLKNGGNPEPDRHLLCARCNLSSPKTGHSFSSYCRKLLTKVCVVLHILAQYCPIAELLAPKLHSFRRSWRWSAPLPAARAASVIFGGKTRFLVRKKRKKEFGRLGQFFFLVHRVQRKKLR